MKAPQPNEHDDDGEPFYHLDRNGALTWTDAGRRTFRRRFARFGLRLEAIETFEQYQTAMRLSAGVFVEDTLEQLAERCAGQPWRELLEAALTGDDAAIARAERRYETRRKLNIISSSRSSASVALSRKAKNGFRSSFDNKGMACSSQKRGHTMPPAGNRCVPGGVVRKNSC